MKKPKRTRSLKTWLDRAEMTQHRLAQLAGVTDSAVSMLLNGERGCSLAVALKLERVTGVPVNALVDWRNLRKKKTSSVVTPKPRKQPNAETTNDSGL